MAKALITIPVEVSDEKQIPTQILSSVGPKKILIYCTNLAGALSDLVGSEKFVIRELVGAVGTAARSLFLKKSGTRFTVTEGTALGVNLATEAGLNQKSFGSFGEFVLRAIEGELIAGQSGGTPAIPAVPAVEYAAAVPASNGSIVVSIPISMGYYNYTSGTGILTFNGTQAGSGAGPSHTDVANALGAFGTVSYDSASAPTASGEIFDFTVALSSALNQITEDTSTVGLGPWYSTGATLGSPEVQAVAAVPAVPASGGTPANAIYIDQTSNQLKFVSIDEIPETGTVLATVERTVTEGTQFFE